MWRCIQCQAADLQLLQLQLPCGSTTPRKSKHGTRPPPEIPQKQYVFSTDAQNQKLAFVRQSYAIIQSTLVRPRGGLPACCLLLPADMIVPADLPASPAYLPACLPAALPTLPALQPGSPSPSPSRPKDPTRPCGRPRC